MGKNYCEASQANYGGSGCEVKDAFGQAPSGLEQVSRGNVVMALSTYVKHTTGHLEKNTLFSFFLC